MQIVVKGNEACIKFWKQASRDDEQFRLMQYLVQQVREEGLLILNTVTGEMILLNEEEQELLKRLPAPYTPQMDELIAHHYLVRENFDEAKIVNQLRKVLQRFGARESIQSFSILPTTACNARCFYCYEADYPQVTMSRDTAEHVVHFIVANCDKSKPVNLHWFGGEPTVGEARIDQISERLTEKGINFHSAMISNGYLFSRAMAKKAKEKWKLQSVQITMDGTEEIYNRTKAYKNAETSPYQRVMRNIGFLLDEGIRVSVRMNVDYYNAEDIKRLIEELAMRFAGKNNFSAYVHELFEDQGFEPVKHDEVQREQLVSLVESLNEYISEKGCQRAKSFDPQRGLPSLKKYYCMADNISSININPRGEIGKCEHELFEHLAGDIFQGYRRDDAKYWLNPKYRKLCQECALFPYCGRMETCPNESDCLVPQKQIRLDSVRKKMLKTWNTTQKEEEP